MFQLFEQFAREAKVRGQRVGARMIGERIRWYERVETRTVSPKLNDHYWPYYARLLMAKYTEFDGFFETRGERFDTDSNTILQECG